MGNNMAMSNLYADSVNTLAHEFEAMMTRAEQEHGLSSAANLGFLENRVVSEFETSVNRKVADFMGTINGVQAQILTDIRADVRALGGYAVQLRVNLVQRHDNDALQSIWRVVLHARFSARRDEVPPQGNA